MCGATWLVFLLCLFGFLFALCTGAEYSEKNDTDVFEKIADAFDKVIEEAEALIKEEEALQWMLDQLNSHRKFGPEITRDNLLELIAQSNEDIGIISRGTVDHNETEEVLPGREEWPTREDVEEGREELNENDPRFDPNLNGYTDSERGKENFVYCAIARETEEEGVAECLTGKWTCEGGVCKRE
jgi:hypothetical protein